ncbi:autophagy protein 5 [Lepeophtheirus salmonis]|nr:autophagy protein 5-like isoform X1 [Lepeophtheirus salmonis]
MSEDREVLREIWEGKIPIRFNLDGDFGGVSEPFYLMLPRQSYLPLTLEKVRKHFSKHTESPNADIWFSCNGSAIRWHLPVGLLFDSFMMGQETEDNDASFHLPWNLNVVFGEFPSEEIIRFNSRESLETYFMSCLKEADQIKHGGRVLSKMQKKDQNQLWQGFQNDKFDQFWPINRRLMEIEGTGENEIGGFRHIPVRIYKGDGPMIQKIVNTLTEDKSKATIKDMLLEFLPDCDVDNLQFLTQGISPPLDTPIQWLSEHLSYPDNFLHICVK